MIEIWLLSFFAFAYFPKIMWGVSYTDLLNLAQQNSGLENILQQLGLMSTTASQWATTKLIICGIVLVFLLAGLISATVNYKNKKNEKREEINE